VTHPEVGRCLLPRRARRRPLPHPSRGGGRSGPADQAPGVTAASRRRGVDGAQAVCGDPVRYRCRSRRRTGRGRRIV